MKQTSSFRRSYRERATLSLALLGLAVLAGCATPVTQRVAVDPNAQAREEREQMRLALKSQWDMNLRLSRVGYPVLKGAAADCADRSRPALGFFARELNDLPAQSRTAMAEAIGIDSQRRIYAVYPRGAAAKAGVQVGDILVSSSAGIPAGGPEPASAARQRMPAGMLVTLNLLREGQPVQVTLIPDQVCDYQLVIENSGDVNAYADGDRILVTRGMMRFAAEDQELALVIGHELGHNTMGHQSKKTTNAMLGFAADLLAAAAKVNTQGAFSKMGAQAYSQDFEREADYVGMYYLARSGYPIDGAAAFWRRMATEYPSTIRTSHSASHPATSERYLALDRTAVEIRGKDQSGLPLNPNKSN